MFPSKNILLSSHGTVGAQAAERMAMDLCDPDASIHHLVVVPDLWKGMMGDDWLNNGVSRDRYGRYIESELGRDIDRHSERLRGELEERGIRYSMEVVVGKPEKCLVDACDNGEYDLVVMGSPRPKGDPGLRSRMPTEPLTQALNMPLLIVPHPHG
ncbi:MAG: universal stress protein [Sedimenticola sp.]